MSFFSGFRAPAKAGAHADDSNGFLPAQEHGVVIRILCSMIRLYQLTLSAFIGRQCRFYPSCSHYAMDGIRRFGALRGIFLGAGRILRCHPFNPGGVDPVPDHFHWPWDQTFCRKGKS